MSKMLRLVAGVPRMVDESGSPEIYDESIKIVSGTAGAGELNVNDAEAGDAITLPNGKTYSGASSGLELQIFLNGNYLEDVLDYNFISTTQFALTFNTSVLDIVRIRIDRGA